MRQPSISLLCLPCAGASVAMYRRWRSLLPDWIRVVPIELPGRGARFNEKFILNFDDLVESLCRGQAKNLTGSYALFGHSMGALLAYGMAHYLRSYSMVMPSMIFASGSAAPSRRDLDRYSHVDDAALIADLHKKGGTPEEAFDSQDLMRIILDVLSADYQLCRSFQYHQTSPLSLPIHVYAGAEDCIDNDQLTPWQHESERPISLTWFNGGHFFIRDQENLVLQSIVRHLLHQFSNVADATPAKLLRVA